MSTSVRVRPGLIAVTALVTALATATPAWAEFPDQGRRVLFTRQKSFGPARGGSSLELFTMKPNGDDQERVIKTDRLAEYGAHWSPNGSQIVFTGIKVTPDIYTADADGKHRGALATTRHNYSPNWSRNGKQIVWSRFTGAVRQSRPGGFMRPWRGGSADLMVMDADGTDKHSIFDGFAVSPGWSPTRGVIAFSTSDGDSLDIWTIKSNGSGLQRLTDFGMGTSTVFGDWSPDGQWFTFMYRPALTRGGSEYRLGIAPVSDPNAALYLASDLAQQFAPVFSANGARLAFVKTDGSDLEIYSVRTDGTDTRQLTTNGVEDVLTYLPLF